MASDLRDVEQRAAELASKNGCVGMFEDESCADAEPRNPQNWCVYCVLGDFAQRELSAENAALRDNNAAVKALFDQKAADLSALREALKALPRYKVQLNGGNSGSELVKWADIDALLSRGHDGGR